MLGLGGRAPHTSHDVVTPLAAEVALLLTATSTTPYHRQTTYRLSMAADRSELLPGTLEMLILKTLTIAPMHGYGIAQHLQQLSDDVLQVEEGSLYPALQRMQLKGWVSSEWGQTPTKRRARYYKLTAAGKKQLVQEVADFDRMLGAIQRVLGTT